MSIEDSVQQWVQTDNKIRLYNEALKELREKRSSLSDQITSYVEVNNINSVSITDGSLKFQNVRVTPPLTFKFVEKCLSEVIPNEEQVSQIINYIKEKREIKYTPDIKRIYNK